MDLDLISTAITPESLGIIISMISLILIALNFKKLREVDISVTSVSTSQWMGFPRDVEICIENVSNNFIPYAQAAIKIYVDSKVRESNSGIISIKKGTAHFITIDFLDILKSFSIVNEKNALLVSGPDLEKITSKVRVYVGCKFSGYNLFGNRLQLFRKVSDTYLVWDTKRFDWRNARSTELEEFR
jgi:hypothetical protein